MSCDRFSYAYNVRISKPRDFDFTLTASVYNFSWWFNGEVLIVPFWDTVALVRDLGSELEVKVFRSPGAGYSNLEQSVRGIEYVLGLAEDLSDFYSIASKDPLLSRSVEVLKGLHIRASTPWIASVIGVCQQNTGFRQGWRMLYSFLKLFGRRAIVDGFETLIPPTPFDIDESKASLLRSASLGYRVRAVLGLAKLFRSRPELNSWSARPGDLEEALLEVKGVGVYTARLALVLSMRVYDKPPIDRWLKKLVSEVYGVYEGDAERFYTRLWGRWSGLAVFYTTVALDAEPLSKALDRVRKGLTIPDKSKLSPLTMWRYL